MERSLITTSNHPALQELKQYALDLEARLTADFNLNWLESEFASNRLAYVRNGLLLAKLKFLKLYKSFGDGTFASFCRERLGITRWQVNDNIKAAQITLELIETGFTILPTNISQAIALAGLAGEELIQGWGRVVDNIQPDQITHKSIKSFLFPTSEPALPITSIQVPPTLHEDIHAEAAERGMSIVDLIKTMFDFFINGGNSHFLQYEIDKLDYVKKERSSESKEASFPLKRRLADWEIDF
ncbi:MAG: hypothetical protein AAFQ80_16965 [Cyanobacteria bacterium J06621_8]